MLEKLTMDLTPIDQASFEAEKLVHDHPPHWRHGNKHLVYEIACSSGFPVQGQVNYARWPKQELPEDLSAPSPFSVCLGVFAYAAPKEPNVVAWHVNFSDELLFVAYGSSLLAQDELQAAEHPALGSLREYLISKDMAAVTEEDGNPTPVTITGVQRRCVIDTQPNPGAGCPNGLYGNAFAQATEEQVRAVTKSLSPPTISNILAIAAPSGGYGTYSRQQMQQILITAYTGFLAAKAESGRLIQGDSKTVINTGFWGCGAFGGNRRLMTILQCLASEIAGVDIVFWSTSEAGVKLATDARHWYEKIREDNLTVQCVMDRLVEEKFQWGVSDGN